ncbi:MAG: Ferredoxin--NADP reductase [Firmicutes bacterium ADurb.Bin080]|jgi:predicted Rossmann fold flavoprotein|nr:MAG: Ferredoxin--NADP reductase [Firmicutes bacterium ADurb.Bin080]
MARVGIFGAGPSGIMAAISATIAGHSVCIIDHNSKIGRKLYISGKGRCNLTNIRPDFISNVVRNPKFLYSSLATFSSEHCMKFFESLGVPLKVERGGRVFPQSDKSSDVIDALYEQLNRLKVKIQFQEHLNKLLVADDRIIKAITDKAEYDFDHYIIATGGLSYPKTGSDGSGLKILKDINISIIETKPALVYMILDELGLPQGLSLRNVNVKVLNENSISIADSFGEMLFTDTGVSGPIILTISSIVNRVKHLNECKLVIDLKPALSLDLLDSRLIRDFESKNNMDLKNVLLGLMPERLINIVLNKANINGDIKANQVSKEARKRLSYIIKNLSFSIKSLGPIEEAIVTSGGVSVNEIDPKSMKSLRYNNLSYAGEMIDVDALTGGYNIQIAFATGYLAGSSI